MSRRETRSATIAAYPDHPPGEDAPTPSRRSLVREGVLLQRGVQKAAAEQRESAEEFCARKEPLPKHPPPDFEKPLLRRRRA